MDYKFAFWFRYGQVIKFHLGLVIGENDALLLCTYLLLVQSLVL